MEKILLVWLFSEIVVVKVCKEGINTFGTQDYTYEQELNKRSQL